MAVIEWAKQERDKRAMAFTETKYFKRGSMEEEKGSENVFEPVDVSKHSKQSQDHLITKQNSKFYFVFKMLLDCKV